MEQVESAYNVRVKEVRSCVTPQMQLAPFLGFVT